MVVGDDLANGPGEEVPNDEEVGSGDGTERSWERHTDRGESAGMAGAGTGAGAGGVVRAQGESGARWRQPSSANMNESCQALKLKVRSRGGGVVRCGFG